MGAGGETGPSPIKAVTRHIPDTGVYQGMILYSNYGLNIVEYAMKQTLFATKLNLIRGWNLIIFMKNIQ